MIRTPRSEQSRREEAGSAFVQEPESWIQTIPVRRRPTLMAPELISFGHSAVVSQTLHRLVETTEALNEWVFLWM